MELVIGTKTWSSWSMRPWLVLKRAGLAFDERVISLRRTETEGEIRAAGSPNGRVPVLHDGGLTVWDSLAIAEYVADRCPEAACWSHARRKFFALADIAVKARGSLPVIAPLAVEAVKRIDAIFAIERQINGLPSAGRLAVRRRRVAPLAGDLQQWMRAERARLSGTPTWPNTTC